MAFISSILSLYLLETITKITCKHKHAHPQIIKKQQLHKKSRDVVQPGDPLNQKNKSRLEDARTANIQLQAKEKEVYKSEAEGNSFDSFQIYFMNKDSCAVQEYLYAKTVPEALKRKILEKLERFGDAIRTEILEKLLAVFGLDSVEKAKEKLCNEFIAKAEEDERYDKRDGLDIGKETRMLHNALAGVALYLCYSINKMPEQQDCYINGDYPQDQECCIIIRLSISLQCLFFHSLGVALSGGKCFIDPKRITSELTEKLQKIQDKESFQCSIVDDLGSTDGGLPLPLPNKNDRQQGEGILITLELPAKLVALFRDLLFEMVEQQKGYELMIDISGAQRDVHKLKAAGINGLPQPASGGQETSEEAASSQEEWLPQSNEDSPSGEGDQYHQSSALPIHSSGDGAVYERTDVKQFVFHSQTQSDLETDEVSGPSPEETHQREADVPRHSPPQSLQESVTTASSHNSTEVSHELGSRAARQNFAETQEEGQAEALSQSFQQTGLECDSEVASTNLPEMLAMPEAEASRHAGLRGPESIASSDSLSEVMVETSSIQSVRVHTPVEVSMGASLDSVFYDEYMLITPPSSTLLHQGSSPCADTSNLVCVGQGSPVMAHGQAEDPRTVSNDTSLSSHGEQYSFHTSPGTHAHTRHEAFPVPISGLQSASPRAAHAHRQPQQPVAECSNPMPTESQRLLYPQGEAEHAAFTSQAYAPCTATQCDRTRDQWDLTNSAPVLHLPPIIVHSASALPPWATQTARIDLSQAANRQLAPLGRRRGTYDDQWPNHSGIDPANMALAGFYRIGPGRQVRCFYCGLQLDHLRSTDNIWDEHVRHRHTCVYLRAIMGEDLVQQTLINLDKPHR